MKIKLLLALLTTITLQAQASSLSGPAPSPTFPGGVSINQTRNFNPHLITIDPPMPILLQSFHTITDKELRASKATQVIIKGEGSDNSYFIQKRLADGSFRFTVAEKNYAEMLDQGVDLSHQDIEVVTDDEYEKAVKNVDLVVLMDISNSISPGCANGVAAGAIGGAIQGGVAGAVVGGFLGGWAGGCFEK
jgi:hypothetical protein